MSRTKVQTPLISHDFSELRKVVLRELSSPHGEDHKVEEALNVSVSISLIGITH